MIAAIEAVRSAIDRPAPSRSPALDDRGGGGLAILAGAVFWLPGALTRQTVILLPEAKRVEIGEALVCPRSGALPGRPATAPRAAWRWRACRRVCSARLPRASC
jgi:hypothetical protein